MAWEAEVTITGIAYSKFMILLCYNYAMLLLCPHIQTHQNEVG